MDYKVVMTSDAEEDLDRHIKYILLQKKNQQAASNVINDFELTKQILSKVAGSLKLCVNPKLKKMGYRKIRFQTHRYFMLYRVVDDMAIIDKIFHELQDYENAIK